MVEEAERAPARPPRRIRSGYRRRMLDHLADGGETVSGIALAVGLRLPHASAELKRMRQDGLVASDAEEGSRGGRQHLTAGGWNRLAEDELARMHGFLVGGRPPSKVGCLLARDGPQLLLAYAKEPASPLIPLPRTPEITPSDPQAYSTGTAGVKLEWVWAVAREREPRWFDLPTLEPRSSPPRAISPESLEAWTDTADVIGLLRARLLDPRRELRLAVGEWFGEPDEDEWPPVPSPPPGTEQEWSLGEAHPATPSVRPAGPVVASLDDRLASSMVLTAAAHDALVIAESSLLGRPSEPLPLAALATWVERAHPRLTTAERNRRLESLQRHLSRAGESRRGASHRCDESTWRRLLHDWGERNWSESGTSPPRLLDVRGLSETAWLSLLEWSVRDSDGPPVVLQHPHGKVDDQLLQTLLASARLRLLLLPEEGRSPTGHPTLRPDPIHPLPFVRLQLATDVSLPVRLTQRPPTAPATLPTDWSAPAGASEVEAAAESAAAWAAGAVAPEVGTDDDPGLRMLSALLRYPDGDVEWADRMENADPHASWVASPAERRWSRWLRCGEQLGEHWIGLLSVEMVPLASLASVAANAPREWERAAHLHLTDNLRREADLGLRLRPLVDDGSLDEAASCWLAAALTSQVAWLGSALMRDLPTWVVQRLAKSPPTNIVEALSALDWLEQQGRFEQGWATPLREAATAAEPDSHLAAWAALLAVYEVDEPLPRSALPALLELPLDWWATQAEQQLLLLLDEPEGRDLLASADVSWPAVILRSPGELCRVPGAGFQEHPGCSAVLRDRLDRLHVQPGWPGEDELENVPGAAALFDLANALTDANSKTAPSSGRTHQHVGWLARAEGTWPDFSADEVAAGEAHIADRLSRRLSGHHTGLLRGRQSRL